MKEIVLQVELIDKIDDTAYEKMVKSKKVFKEFEKYIAVVTKRIEVMGFKVVKLELTK